MTIDLLILLAVNITNSLLGLGIFLRNPRSLANRVFACLSFAIVFWATMNYVADHTSLTLTPLFTRLTFFGGILIAISVVWLSRVFPDERLLGKKLRNTIQPALALIMGALSLTPLIVDSAAPSAAGAQLVSGPLYIFYLIYILQAVTTLIINLSVQAKKAKVGYRRNQVDLVLGGILLYAFFAILSNMIIPLFMNSWASSRFGPVFSLVLVGSVAYAIAKHKLFDIRWALARSISYVGVFILFAGLYGLVVFGIVDFVFQLQIPFVLQVAISVTTGLAAASFSGFRQGFDRLTKKIFYKYDFDSQEFFEAFNKSIAVPTEPEKLMRDASATIIQFLNIEYCTIYVVGKESYISYEDHRRVREFSLSDKEKFITAFREINNDIIVVDELPPEREALRRYFYANQIAVLISLHATEQDARAKEYMVLGSKRNGGSYNKKDISVLLSAANELSLALQNALRFEQIQSFNATLRKGIEEATRKLRATNAELQRLDEAKDEFVSMASHQLRTPLTSVKGYISMVLEGDAGKLTPMQRQLLSESFTSSERMVHLINDFLNVSRLQTGKFMLDRRETNLAQLVAQEVEGLQTTAHMHNMEIKYHKPSYFPQLYLDEGKIRQVIMNFIDNAIYYSKEGDKITVQLSVVDGDAVFEVKDMGIGVPKDEQSRLFGKFFRATNARKQRPDGTGVGLFLAKRVVVAHGGAIVFESTEGKGSTFGFRLPVKKLSRAPAKRANKLKK